MSQKGLKELRKEVNDLREILVKRNPMVFDRFAFLLQLTEEIYGGLAEARMYIQTMNQELGIRDAFLKEKEQFDEFKEWVKAKEEEQKKKMEKSQAEHREALEKKKAEQEEKLKELEKDGN